MFPEECFVWNSIALDLSIHTEVFASCDGNPFDEEDKRTNWRVCAWEESINGEHAGAVVLHNCQDGEEARAIVHKARALIQNLPFGG